MPLEIAFADNFQTFLKVLYICKSELVYNEKLKKLYEKD